MRDLFVSSNREGRRGRETKGGGWDKGVRNKKERRANFKKGNSHTTVY